MIVYHCFVIANIILADKCLFLFIFEAASIEQNDTTWAKKKVAWHCLKFVSLFTFYFLQRLGVQICFMLMMLMMMTKVMMAMMIVMMMVMTMKMMTKRGGKAGQLCVEKNV